MTDASIGASSPPPIGPFDFPPRRRLPATRRSLTSKSDVGGVEIYVTVSFYDFDDRVVPGEIFVVCAKEGSTLGALADIIATSISIGLQFGVPWYVYRDKLRHTRFEPTGYSNIAETEYSSLADCIADTVDRLLSREASDRDIPTDDNPTSTTMRLSLSDF